MLLSPRTQKASTLRGNIVEDTSSTPARLLLLHKRNFNSRRGSNTGTSTLSASSWGDEGEYFEYDDEPVARDNRAGGGNDEREKLLHAIRGAIGRILARSYPILKVAVSLSAIALSIFRQGLIQKASASLLAVLLALGLSKRIPPSRKRKNLDASMLITKNNKSAKTKESARTWLNATLGNIERIDEEVAEEKRKKEERRQAERLEQGRRWARASLATTDELKRQADEARKEEARTREWTDATLKRDMERQRAADRARWGDIGVAISADTDIDG